MLNSVVVYYINLQHYVTPQNKNVLPETQYSISSSFLFTAASLVPVITNNLSLFRTITNPNIILDYFIHPLQKSVMRGTVRKTFIRENFIEKTELTVFDNAFSGFRQMRCTFYSIS